MQGCYSTVSLRNVSLRIRIKKYTSDLVKMKIHIHYNPKPHSSESALTNLLPVCHNIHTAPGRGLMPTVTENTNPLCSIPAVKMNGLQPLAVILDNNAAIMADSHQ